MKKSAAYFGLFTFENRIRLREWNWKMESGANTKEVLTPKNVYRFLTDNLPGLYPHGVIPAAERKGLTLVKFWTESFRRNGTRRSLEARSARGG